MDHVRRKTSKRRKDAIQKTTVVKCANEKRHHVPWFEGFKLLFLKAEHLCNGPVPLTGRDWIVVTSYCAATSLAASCRELLPLRVLRSDKLSRVFAVVAV